MIGQRGRFMPIRAGFWLTLALASGCALGRKSQVQLLDVQIDAEHPASWRGVPVETGQVLLSEGPRRAWSILFSLAPARYYDFTHAALVVVEEGEPFVYDFSGKYKPGFDERPTDGIVGGMRRQRLADYMQPNVYAELFDPPPGLDPEALAQHVHERMAQDLEFDPYFRFDEHERLFCTEFVELALRAAGAEPNALVPMRQNPSLVAFMDWVEAPTDAGLPAGAFAQPARYRAAFGKFANQTEAYAYFAAKHELHRRFTDDQKLGNVFRMKGSANIELRPDVVAFVDDSMRLFSGAEAAPEREAIEASVRALAAESFGPLVLVSGEWTEYPFTWTRCTSSSCPSSPD